jgi:hypothetical protein
MILEERELRTGVLGNVRQNFKGKKKPNGRVI